MANLRSAGGAAFLMATSAIGHGFLTQTAVFTEKMLEAFALVIVLSLLFDIGVQVNIWRIIAVSHKRGQELANGVVPGLGYLLSLLIVGGGLVFNIGNIAGTGLGLEGLFGIPQAYGAVLSLILAVGVFLSPQASIAMERLVRILGALMLLLTLYVAVLSKPSLAKAAGGLMAVQKLDVFALATIIGGTVGGYISFAGGHRLLEAGISGKAQLPLVTKSACFGLIITTLMRALLFLAVLGVLQTGIKLDPANPSASVFFAAAGSLGGKLFGLVLWAASITSVIGATYTSLSFVHHPFIQRHQRLVAISFMALSTLLFLCFGEAVTVLIVAGAVNSCVLPLALTAILMAAYKKALVGDYRQPWWLTLLGGSVVLASVVMAIKAFY